MEITNIKLVRAWVNFKTINNVQQVKIKQKEIINEVENGNVKLKTNKQKGNYGEMKMDVHFESKGFDRISNEFRW